MISEIKAGSITEKYADILNHVMQYGDKTKPRGMEVCEATGYNFYLKDVTQPFVLLKERKLNYAYCILEPFLLTQPQTKQIKDACCFYVGKFLEKHVVNPDTGLMDGWYGSRMMNNDRNQLLDIYEILKKDPNSRRAVLTIHDSKTELTRKDSLDICCTLNVQFLIREDKLDMVVYMRSNDVMLGTPQNVAMWTFFQRMMAAWLGIKAGGYSHMVGSAHLYERDFEKAQKIIDNPKIISNEELINFDWAWPIQDPKESLKQCALFVEAEYQYRQCGIAVTGELHPWLKEILDRFIFPYIDKKKAKLRKFDVRYLHPFARGELDEKLG